MLLLPDKKLLIVLVKQFLESEEHTHTVNAPKTFIQTLSLYNYNSTDSIVFNVWERWIQIYYESQNNGFRVKRSPIAIICILILSVFTTRPCSTGVRTIVVSIWQCSLFSYLLFASFLIINQLIL